MSMRQRATQCLRKQLPDKPQSRPSNTTSRWPGHHVRWHEEQERSKLSQTGSSPASVASIASERMYRSRDTVKAWLESSPTSVLENLDDESPCASSFESFNSSPVGSVEHLSCTTRFRSPASKIYPAGHARSRTISPPRCTANRNSVDLSRIDPAHYNGGSFLVLAFKNAQYRGASSPPAFLYSSEAVGDDHVQCLNVEECESPRSEFSLTSEWQNMLAAGNAAGMSTRDSSGNNSDCGAPGEVLNISDLDLDSDVCDPHVNPQVVSMPHRRTRSVELPHMHERSAGVESGDFLVDDNKYTCASAKLERRQTDAGRIHEQGPVRRLSRRNSISFTSMREAFGEVENRKVQSTTAAWEETECAKLISRYEREEKEIKFWEDCRREKATSNVKQAESKLEVKGAHLMDKMQNDMAMACSKAEEKKATAEVKRPEKAARAAMEVKLIRRTGKVPRGCLFLV